jgi:uncharacterized protein (UPF0303 family)
MFVKRKFELAWIEGNPETGLTVARREFILAGETLQIKTEGGIVTLVVTSIGGDKPVDDKKVMQIVTDHIIATDPSPSPSKH